MNIIMLGGFAKSGKDTVGKYLLNYGFKRYAFADKLKDIVSEEYKINRELMDTQIGKASYIENQTTIRDLLIQYGEAKRRENPNFWCEYVYQSMVKNNDLKVVITDFRFPNEYEYFKSLHPFHLETWKISRFQESEIDSDTETSLNDFTFDKIIDNSQSINNLTKIIDEEFFIKDILE